MTDVIKSKGDRTQTALVEVAYVLFTQQGYHGTSMRQIAEKAGLALGGIYNHFANKEEIFEAVVLAYHPFVRIMPQLAVLKADSTEALLRAAARLTLDEIEQQPGLFNLLFIEFIELNGRHVPALVERIMPHALPFQARVMADASRLRINDPLLFLRSFMGNLLAFFVIGEFLQTVPLAGEMDLDVDRFMDLYLYGLLKQDA